jgi:hypothetical protein
MGTISLPVITAQQISIIGTLAGHMPDPNRTHVAMLGTDCGDAPPRPRLCARHGRREHCRDPLANNLPDPKGDPN